MKLRETYPQQVLEKLMSYVYVDGVRLSETSPIEFWREKSYPNVGAVKLRETYPSKFLRNQAEEK